MLFTSPHLPGKCISWGDLPKLSQKREDKGMGTCNSPHIHGNVGKQIDGEWLD